MKGITPVIATILLLLMVVAISGIAFTFFGNVVSTTTEGAGAQIEKQVSDTVRTVRIASVNKTAVFIESTSSVTIPLSQIRVYYNGSYMGCTLTGADPLVPYNLTTCNMGPFITGGLCVTGAEIRVTSPAGAVVDTCP